jgi:SAM-dependent methyltransferase
MFMPPRVGNQEFYSTIAETNTYYVAEKWEFTEALKDLKRHRIHRILDVGCGNGYFLDLLRESNLSIQYAGYEFNSQIASQARTKGHRVYDGEFPESIFPAIQDAPFDAVCLFQLLEHVSDPIILIKDVMRLLVPQGILIIGVPDAEGPLQHFSSALTDIPPHHVSRWCESVFQLGMPHQGLRMVRRAYEPLPWYLWSSYLPVILEKDIQPTLIGKALNRTGMTQRLIHLLMFLGIKRLRGIPGHTLYVVLKRE